MKAKMILRGEDGMTEHAQGIVNFDNYTSHELVERNRHIYKFIDWRYENSTPVLFYNKTKSPVLVTEF